MVRLGDIELDDSEAENWFNSLSKEDAEQVASLTALRAFLITLAISSRSPQFSLINWRETHADIRLVTMIVRKIYWPWRPSFSSPPITFRQISDERLDFSLNTQARFASCSLQNANFSSRQHWFEALKFCALALARMPADEDVAEITRLQNAVTNTWSKVIEHAKGDASDLASRHFTELASPLFSEDWLSGELGTLWRLAVSRNENDPPEGPRFEYWRDWYRGLLTGQPFDWELQRLVASMDDEIWNEEPDVVAAKIEEIQARWQVEKALVNLKVDFGTKSQSRFGIGGNNPPKDKQLAQSLSLIWTATEELSDTINQENPKRERVEKILEQLKASCLALTKWIGRKADLAVDTTIETVIKQGGPLAVGYYALDKLIEAIEEWLPFLF